MPRYPSLAPILHDRMLQVVELYRRAASLELPPSAILHALDALAARIFPQIHKLLDVSTIVAPVPFNRSLLAQHPTFTPNLRLLVARALTAQLQCGSIVVLGSDPANVISWVCFLAQFVVESQRHVACVKVRHGIESYVPDLALQGIVCAKGASLDAEALVQGVTSN